MHPDAPPRTRARRWIALLLALAALFLTGEATPAGPNGDPAPGGALASDASPASAGAPNAPEDAVARPGSAAQPGAQIAGRVVRPTGDPATEATLVIVGSGIWPARTIETREDGSFVFGGVPPGVYEIRAFEAALVSEPRRGLSVDSDERSYLTISLHEGIRVGGIIVDATTSDPIADAQITMSTQTLDASPRVATSGTDGRFRVDGLGREAHVVSAHADGYVPVFGLSWTPGTPLTLELQPAATVAGVVLDAEGQPVEGASIEVLGEDDAQQPIALTGGHGFRAAVFESAAQVEAGGERGDAIPGAGGMALPVTEGAVPPIPIGPGFSAPMGSELTLTPLPRAPSEGAWASAYLSDHEGRFRVTGIPPGHIQVVARSSGLAPAATERLYVAVGSVRDDLELVLQPAGRLLGRVVDHREYAVPGVVVEIRSDREPHPRVAITGDDGRFEVAGVVGELTVTALPAGRPATRARAQVAEGGDTEITLSLEGTLSTLTGRTVDGRGYPVAGARVRVASLRADSPTQRTLFSEEDGTFSVAALPSPPWRVEAFDPSYAPTVVDVFDADEDVSIALGPGARVGGTILDEVSAEPVSATVELRRDDLPPEILTGRTDAEGAFAFERVRPGTWTLTVRSTPHLPSSREVVVEDRGRGPADVSLDPLRLVPAARLEGTVVDALGVPIARAEVQGGGEGRSVRTDTDGRFVLLTEAGMTEIRATHPAAGEGHTEARGLAGRETPGLVVHLSERFDPARAATLPGRRRGVALTVGRAMTVTFVSPESGAERAGIRAGDRLLEIDGETPQSAAEAARLLAGAPSVPAIVRLRRGDREARLVVEREVWFP